MGSVFIALIVGYLRDFLVSIYAAGAKGGGDAIFLVSCRMPHAPQRPYRFAVTARYQHSAPIGSVNI